MYTIQCVIEFKPTTNGLHALNLKTNPEAAFLLVNDADLKPSKPEGHQVHVATVRNNYEHFSRKQIEGAQATRQLMGMVATPSMRDFNALVHLNMIPDRQSQLKISNMLTHFLARTLPPSGVRQFGANRHV